jgi:copper chaperone CopZ
MTTLTRIFVPGVTGSDGVSALTQALKNVPGIGRMTVQLNTGADSIVSIMSAVPMSDDNLRTAVDSAGYAASAITVTEDALARQMAEQAPARQALRNPTRAVPVVADVSGD